MHSLSPPPNKRGPFFGSPVQLQDETGASDDPWSKWTRQWTAEENRHGIVLNKYLYLSGW